jgi:hypothetical protein
LESKLSGLKQRRRSLKDRFDLHYEALRIAKFTDPDGARVKALLNLIEEDHAEMQSVVQETKELADIFEEVKRDHKSLAGVILSTATAVLGLTATHSGNLIPEQPNAIGLLISSWFFLAGTIIAFPMGS